MSVSLADQLKCAKRELALRRSAYPKWVTAKRINPLKAENEIAAMAAIVATLEQLIAQSSSG